MNSTNLILNNKIFENSFWIALTTFITAFLVRYAFENTVKGFFKKTKTKLDDKIIAQTKTPIFLTVILIGSQFFMLSLSVDEKLLEFVNNSLLTVGVLIWSIAMAGVSKILLKAYYDAQVKDTRLGDALPFLQNLIVLSIFSIALLIALDLWGINITPLVASAGVAGIAVAFAAKDTISNLFGGISVFFDRPYKTGDYVIIDSQYRGEVIEIGMRSTKIRTRDNVLITIPNSVMVTNAVINETGFDPKLRIRVPIGVSYDGDLDKIEYVIKSVLQKHPKVLNDPEPRIRFRNFGSSAIELEALGVIERPAEKGLVVHELIKNIHKAFREEKIVIPYPQTVVHMYKEGVHKAKH